MKPADRLLDVGKGSPQCWAGGGLSQAYLHKCRWRPQTAAWVETEADGENGNLEMQTNFLTRIWEDNTSHIYSSHFLFLSKLEFHLQQQICFKNCHHSLLFPSPIPRDFSGASGRPRPWGAIRCLPQRPGVGEGADRSAGLFSVSWAEKCQDSARSIGNGCLEGSVGGPGRGRLGRSELSSSWVSAVQDGEVMPGGPMCRTLTHSDPLISHERA